MLLASGGERQGMLLTILLHTEHPEQRTVWPTVSSWQGGKPWFTSTQHQMKRVFDSGSMQSSLTGIY